MRMRSEGIEVDVPQGWDGEIYRRSSGITALSGPGDQSRPVMHMANFPLPSERGDFGSGAVELMRSDNLLVVLFEYGPESAGSPLFSARGVPTVSAGDFHPNAMQRPLPGQSGAQYFFSVGGRAFCLYVALGSHLFRHELVPKVNEILGVLRIDG
ncbi:MAG TPA: hypothetical protein VI980_03730 [Acidimicrobiia bacterium]|nr:hypothetical protein [Acidimicrobiia bacterium]